ncbi:hypothetical protein NKH14_17425 [Mesorhizobium sp. M1380]|uniref:hypothetical protein n=1 Tax=Mesorhizobium sp. M1380 TaxID=2957093 RepID=UPI00333D5771
MTTKISIESKQEFTSLGGFGSLLFTLGPCASAIGYAWLISELANTYSYSRNTGGPALLIGGGGLAFLLGCVLMLIGRTYNHQVTVNSPPTTPS